MRGAGGLLQLLCTPPHPPSTHAREYLPYASPPGLGTRTRGLGLVLVERRPLRANRHPYLCRRGAVPGALVRNLRDISYFLLFKRPAESSGLLPTPALSRGTLGKQGTLGHPDIPGGSWGPVLGWPDEPEKSWTATRRAWHR